MSRRALSLGALAALAALVATGCGSTKMTKTVTVQATAKQGVGAPEEKAEFGHIKSLKAKGGGYVMRFDPEWFLSGVTANTAAAEDGAVDPGQPVPNDNYLFEEGHRLLTYLVSGNARVTVLTEGPKGSPITVAQLAEIVDGKSNLKLFEPITTGFWIQIKIDTVTSLDQQYHP